MAPEQAAGQPLDSRADVYALGAVLYECLTGRPPFRGASVLETLEQVRSRDPIPPTRLQPGVPRDLETICLTCLAREPARRYASATAFAEDLERFLDGRPIRARPVGVVGRTLRWARRRPAVAGLVLAVVVVGLLGLGGILWQLRETSANLAAAQRHLYAQRIALADREWQANRPDQAERLLRLCPPNLRGWEFDYLWHNCRQDIDHWAPGPVLQVCFSPNQRDQQLALTTADGKLHVRGSDLHTPLRTLEGFGPAVAYSADGALLASATWKLGRFGELPREQETVIQVWDARSGKELHRFPGHRGAVFSLAFSPDGQWLASGSLDGTVRLWSLTGKTEPRILSGHTRWVECVAFHPNSRLLASAATDETVCVWDVPRGNRVRVFSDQDPSSGSRGRGEPGRGVMFNPRAFRAAELSSKDKVKNAVVGRPEGPDEEASDEEGTRARQTVVPLRGQMHNVACLAFSADGTWLAAGRGNTIQVWEVATWRETTTLRGHTDLVRCLLFHPSKPWLFAGDYDRALEVWDWKLGKKLATLRGHAGPINSLSLDIGNNRLVSGSWDGTARLWNPDALEQQTLRGHRDYARGLAFAAEGRILVTGGADGRILVRDLLETGPVKEFTGHTGNVNGVRCDAAGEWLASAGYDGSVRLWPMQGGEPRVLSGHRGKVYDVAFSPDGQTLASAGEDGTVRTWDRSTGEQTGVLEEGTGRVLTLDHLPNSSLLAAAGDDGVVSLLDTRRGVCVRRWVAHEAGVSRLAVWGHRLATGSPDHTVRLWDGRSGQLLGILEGHTEAVTAVAFSTDGKRVVSASLDRTVRVWDAETGQELLSLRGHGQEVLSLAFSPDGSCLAGSNVAGTVTLWSVVRE
jgi:WD40 repeat protein